MRSFVIRTIDAHVRVQTPAAISVWLQGLLADLVIEPAADTGRATAAADLPALQWKRRWSRNWQLRLAGQGSMSNVETAGALAESLVAINRCAAESAVDHAAVLHAGTFTVDGTAIALSGASGAGKSTAVAAAVTRGLGYLSDEVCAIDPRSLMVAPYHRPLGMRAAGAAAVGVPIPSPASRYSFVFPLRVSTVGALAPSAPLGLIAFVQRTTGPVAITELRPAEALVRLTGASLGAVGKERQMFRRFETLARSVKVVQIQYHDVFAAIDALTTLVSR